jgi:hypothetical protein
MMRRQQPMTRRVRRQPRKLKLTGQPADGDATTVRGIQLALVRSTSTGLE